MEHRRIEPHLIGARLSALVRVKGAAMRNDTHAEKQLILSQIGKWYHSNVWEMWRSSES